MSGFAPLSTRRHHALRFDPMAGAAARRLFQIGLSEVGFAATDMPVCLSKDAATGTFNLVALTSLVTPANLFVSQGRYRAIYLPQAARLTAFRLDPAGLEGLALDETDAALTGEGDALFIDGRATDLVRDARAALDRLLEDIEAARRLAAAYADLRLIRPMTLNVKFGDGGQHRIDGLYTFDHDAIAALDDAAILRLHRDDRLAPPAVCAGSIAQIERLRQLHNAVHDRPIDRVTISALT